MSEAADKGRGVSKVADEGKGVSEVADKGKVVSEAADKGKEVSEVADKGKGVREAADKGRVCDNKCSDDHGGKRREWPKNFPENSNGRPKTNGNREQRPAVYGRKNKEDSYYFLSKQLSFLLRHGAEKAGYKLMDGGFLYVDEILWYQKNLQDYTEDDVKHIVSVNDKQRFAIEEEPNTGRLKIRANQGHTLQVQKLDLTPIRQKEDCPTVIHGTYLAPWNSIKMEGLCCMGRNHIHFAAGTPGESGVISGMRKSCEVMIFINLEDALKDGLEFFRSANNVILSAGNEDGVLLPRYFESAVQISPYSGLSFDREVTSKRPVGANYAYDQKKKGKNNRKNNKNKAENDEETKQKVLHRKKKEKKNDEANDFSELLEEGNVIDNMFLEPPDAWDNFNGQNVSAREACSIQKGTGGAADESVGSNKGNILSGADYLSGEKIVNDLACKNDGVEQSEEEMDECIEDEWEMITITDAETSQSAIDFLLENTGIPLVVICKGRNKPGTEQDISTLVLISKSRGYIYNLPFGDNSIIKDGKVYDLFFNQKITKLFYGCAAISLALYRQFNIILDGTPVYDTQVVFRELEKDKKNSNVILKLKEMGFPPRGISGHEASEMFAKAPLRKNKIADIVTNARIVARAYTAMKRCFGKSIKRQIFEEVNSLFSEEEMKDSEIVRKTLKNPKQNPKQEQKQNPKQEQEQKQKQKQNPKQEQKQNQNQKQKADSAKPKSNQAQGKKKRNNKK